MIRLVRCAGIAVVWAAGLAGGQAAMGAVTNADFIKQAYQDLLGRAPLGTELTTYESYLTTHTRQQTALSIDTSTEYYGIVVDDLYSQLLHRADSAGERNTFVTFITSGATIEQTQAQLAGSNEYFSARSGSTNSGFITAVISDLLGRSATPTELSLFGSQLTSGSTRTDIATEILASNEYRSDLVSGYYMEFLHRTPSTPDTNLFVSQLQLGTRDEVVISEIIGSDEYFNNIAVPEPATLSLAVVGLVAASARRRI